jgi:transposase-like protein
MEKKQLNLSDKLPLSVVPDPDIKCVYCGSKSYKYKETIVRKNGTKAKVFNCNQCHQQFRDNYQASIKIGNKYKTGEYKKEYSVCPHCHRKNYKKTGTYLRKDGTTVQRLKCKSCQKNFSNTYQINSLKFPLKGVFCPQCSSTDCIKSGKVNKRTQYRCKDCGRAFILAKDLQKTAHQWLPEDLTIEEMYNYDVWDLTVLGFQRNPCHSDIYFVPLITQVILRNLEKQLINSLLIILNQFLKLLDKGFLEGIYIYWRIANKSKEKMEKFFL